MQRISNEEAARFLYGDAVVDLKKFRKRLIAADCAAIIRGGFKVETTTTAELIAIFLEIEKSPPRSLHATQPLHRLRRVVVR